MSERKIDLFQKKIFLIKHTAGLAVLLWAVNVHGSLLYDSQLMSKVEVKQVQDFIALKKRINFKKRGGKRNELPIEIAVKHSPYSDEIVPLYVSAGSPLKYTSSEWGGNIFHTIAQSYNDDEERLVRVFYFVSKHLEKTTDRRVRRNLTTHLINQYDRFGFAPLHYLSTKDNPLLLTAYLEAGADVNLPTLSEKHTPLMLAFGHSNGKNFDKVLEVLLSHGADVKVQAKDGITAMHFAFGAHSLSGVMMLYASGAELDAKNKDGDTPLDHNGYGVLKDFLSSKGFHLTTPKTHSIKKTPCKDKF